MDQEIFNRNEMIPCLNLQQREHVEQIICNLFPEFDREHVIDDHTVKYCIDDVPSEKYEQLLNNVGGILDTSFTVSIHEEAGNIWLLITDTRPTEDMQY